MSFRRVENLHDASKITLKYSSRYRWRVLYIYDASWKYATIIQRVVYILSSKFPTIFQCYFRRVVHISDASRKTLNYSSIFPRRVENVPDASPKYATIFQWFWTRHANLRRVENYIYDPSARIIKNPLNSTVFWKRRLNPATRRLNSATRPLNSATRQILHWNIVVYFDEASSQLGKASSQLGDASAQLRDASKMQLWPQWLTIVICVL